MTWALLCRDPARLLLVAAIVAACALYLPVLGYGIVNHDDNWLISDNVVVRDFSVQSLATVLFDTSAPTRFVLGAEYLPVRDVSVMLDHAVWGTLYGGHHLTSLVVYLALLVVWFRALVEFGVDRTVVGVAILIWAVMPAHAESVAWLSERKGLLAALFAGMTAIAYTKFRAGRSVAWVGVAALCAVAAVWSKAPAVFAVAALAPLELICGERRISRRRAIVGLAVIAVAAGAAFVPVLLTAMNMQVVSSENAAPAGHLAMAAGLHGFYLQLAFLVHRNAISYPITIVGPSTLDIVLGIVGFGLAIGMLVPSRGRWRPPTAMRVGAVIWLCAYFPASRILLPLRAVIVSDRYILLASLGIAIVIAAALLSLRERRMRNALVATLVLAGAMRTLDARTNWRDSLALWQRATESNPYDGAAWSSYVEQLVSAGEPERAVAALREGRRHSNHPRLVLRAALMALSGRNRADAIELLEQASRGGEPRAMANLALLLAENGRGEEALAWARKAVHTAPLYAHGHRMRAEVALVLKRPVEALLAGHHAHALSPGNTATRYVLALALIELHQHAEARSHLEACVDDPKVGASCKTALGQLPF